MNRSALKKLRLVLFIGLGVWVIIWARMFYLQAFCHQRALEILARQQNWVLKLSGHRGRIYDRNLIPLACGVRTFSLYAIPDSVTNPERSCRILAEVLGLEAEQVLASLASDRDFVWLKRKVSPDQLLEFEQWGLSGVYLLEEERRYYPKGNLGRSFLGYTDIDNGGIAGLEKVYDALLRPKTVKIPCLRDARGGIHLSDYRTTGAIADGLDLVLTVDVRLQEIVESELRSAVDLTRALSGMAIFMDPCTGEILALASYIRGREWSAYNKVVVDCFEPGSTFKLLTFASALEHGVFGPGDLIDGEEGECRFPGIVVHDHQPHGLLSFRRAFELSSNVISAKIARQLGWERFCQTLRAFGIGEKTCIDLPGENPGVVAPFQQPDEVTLTTMAFGQGVAINALRLLCCYAAVANGGAGVSPMIVKRVLSGRGEVLPPDRVSRSQALWGQRIISPQTASTLVAFMEGAVDSGTALQARMYNLKVAGKTGTAQKPLEGEKGYKPGAYVASFVGFLPSQKPRLLGLVVVDEPQGEHYGGQVAAPVFRRIVEKALVLPGYEIEAPQPRRPIESLTQRKPRPTEEPLSRAQSYALETGGLSDFPSQ